ncbi:MAG: NAD(P)/FAD-dependent oxidoreductase [Beijerinckiaceae bacterium]
MPLNNMQPVKKPERLLIIGNGMASVRLLEALLRRSPDAFEITVVGEEARPAYNRVLLSALLATDVTQTDIILRERDWYDQNGIDLISGDPVVSVDREARTAMCRSGQTIAFDRCVFATGSEAFRLPIKGIDLPGVMTFRTTDDVVAMDTAARAGQKIAVIGGGLLGIEAAYGLAKIGADVTLVHVMDRLMERQLDAPAAALLKKTLGAKGIGVRLESKTVAITGDTKATGLAFDDGKVLPADCVICAVGIKPRAALASAAGLAVNRGIVVDDFMATDHPGFYALGECAEHRGIAYGLVEPAYAQAETLAAALVQKDRSPTFAFQGMVLATNLKVSGVPVFSAGEFTDGTDTASVVLNDTVGRIYRKLVFRKDQLVGCVMVGDSDDGLWYLDLIRSGVDISAIRNDLIHGQAFATQPDLSKAA